MTLRTLVLNGDMQPISVFPLETIPAKDAVTRIVAGTCYVVSSHDIPLLTKGDMGYLNLTHWPSVMARKDYDFINRFTPLNENSLYYRDHAICAYCNVPLVISSDQKRPDALTMDHVIPQSIGGRKIWENIVASCRECNSEKANSLPIGKWKPRVEAFAPRYMDLVATRRKYPITVDNENWIPHLGKWENEIQVRPLVAA